MIFSFSLVFYFSQQVFSSPMPSLGRYKDPFLNQIVGREDAVNSIDGDPSLYVDEIKFSSMLPLTGKDFERAELLPEVDIIGNDSALYSEEFFEGDIVDDLRGRNAILSLQSRWPSGRIPYVVSNKFTERDRSVIAKGMKTYHDNTCIKFEPKTENDRDYIYIYPGLGCASLVGRIGNMQPVLLGKGCVYSGIVEHELMHAVGFWHEQSRADRDQYVRINWQNIERGMAYNFAKFTLKEIQHLGENYDYGSVMHYGTHAFAKGRSPSITPLKAGAAIGQRRGLSKVDISKINKLYECSKNSKLRVKVRTG